MKKIFLYFLLLWSNISLAQFTVQLRVQWPTHTPDSVYLAGDINGWNPAAPAYRLQPTGNTNGQLRFTVNEPRPIEFKFVRGTWSKVETNSKGRDIENRRLVVESDTTFTLSVAGWKDGFAYAPPVSTASKNVRVADTAFFMPQLQTRRAIRVYLPPGYAGGRNRYPVLYMHDGQNLFDETLNPFGEWGVDEFLDSAKMSCIVVAIDHGGAARMNEYNPYDNLRFGKGKGKAYADFLVKTLKPYIDKNFRTQKGPQFTAIAGSSMGGLISFYAGLKYPNVFGRVGVLSPSFWINYPEVEAEIDGARKRNGQRYFIYAGQQESETLLAEVIGIFNRFSRKLPNNPVRLSIKADGRHNENSWRRLLPEFFTWLKAN